MRVGTNIPALQAFASLRRANILTEKSTLRISSGKKINSAADDPAGMSISTRLYNQTSGIALAGRNSSDGISIMQTADAALGQIQEMLQRIRELSVKASNDTYDQSDRQKIQAEINQLNEEIDSIANKAEFNKIKLFSGEADVLSTSKTSKVLKMTNELEPGDYKFNVTSAPSKSLLVGATPLSATATFPDESLVGELEINGFVVKITAEDTEMSVYQKIKDAAANTGLVVTSGTNGAIIGSLESEYYGSAYEIRVTSENSALLDALGINADSTYTSGKDAQIEIITKETDLTSKFTKHAKYTVDGDRITFSELNSQKMVVQIEAAPLSSYKDFSEYLVELKQQIYDQITIVNEAYDNVAAIQSTISSVATASAAITLTDELMANTTTALNAGQKAKDLMYEAVGKYPQLKNYPEYYNYINLLYVHDNHVYDYYDYAEESANLAISAASTGNITAAKNYLSNLATSGYALGDKSYGGGVCGCSHIIATQAYNIVQDVMNVDPVYTIDQTVTIGGHGLVFQVGSNQNMELEVRIPKINATALGLDRINCLTHEKAQDAIAKCDAAISYVSEIRTILGASQNRLAGLEQDLGVMSDSTQRSASRFFDTDMALEISELTKHEMVTQASIAILAQANQIPQKIISLIK